MEGETQGAAKTPAHVPIVGVLSLLWNSYGAYDYAMTQLKGDAYMQAAGMNAVQIAYVHTLPVWNTAAWAMGVWAGVLGSILLLARSRFAVWAFAASLAGLVASLIHTYVVDQAASRAAGAQAPGFSAMLLAVCIGLLFYAARVTRAGHLR